MNYTLWPKMWSADFKSLPYRKNEVFKKLAGVFTMQVDNWWYKPLLYWEPLAI